MLNKEDAIPRKDDPGQGRDRSQWLDGLCRGTQRAILALGRGFLAHRENRALRGKLVSGEVGPEEFCRQLVRLVFRLWFLFMAEDRGLLFAPGAKPSARLRNEREYSTKRLRQLAEQGGNQDADLFRGFTVVLERLAKDWGGNKCRLSLRESGGFLWSPEVFPDLLGCRIANGTFVEAIRALTVVQDTGGPRPVDFRLLNAQDLGSVYESLLELQPWVDAKAGAFELREIDEHERKTTGSYYTPLRLIEHLLDLTLAPLLQEAETGGLDLRICDPACGSGHFLVAAARRIARRLARLRTGDQEPDAGVLSRALSDVVERCLYGVDVNPLAVELCKITLWLGCATPGKPLAFLDRQIQCGNSLLGAMPQTDRPSGFDLVLGNPPWLSYSGRQAAPLDPGALRSMTRLHPSIATWPAAHSAFLLQAASLVRPGGRLGLVLPLQMSYQERYQPVRAAVASCCRDIVVIDAGEQAFPGVIQAVGLFTATVGQSPSLPMQRDGEPWPAARAPWLEADHAARRPVRQQSRAVADILDRLARLPKFPAGVFSDPGVHTGNVSKRIVSDAFPEQDPAYAPVREGRDLGPYFCGPSRKRLWTEPPLKHGEYCRIGPLARYASAPILLRQTANRPVAARHCEPTYFRNSLLACAGLPEVKPEVLVAVFNSCLMALWHGEHAGDARQRVFPQVKVRHLQSLPLFDLDALAQLSVDDLSRTLGQQLVSLVHEAEAICSSPASFADQRELGCRIERLVLQLYDAPSDAAEILWALVHCRG